MEPDNVLALTSETFDSVVGKGAPALVEFYAPVRLGSSRARASRVDGNARLR
jgi:hypothetical protein